MALLNFRDVAQGMSDGPLPPGRLFRSAQPYHLDDADLAVLRESRIRTVIDLRQQHEQVAPDWQPAVHLGLRVVRVPVADQILPSADEQGPPQRDLVDPDTVPEGHRILAAFYRAIVDQAGARLAELVTAVADGGPVLLHCAAGKDRTGTTVALLLDLIGTDPEAIVADFLRTNAALDDVLTQLTGETTAERAARSDIPPGISDAPEFAIRDLLRHVAELGGARAVLGRTVDQATLDRAVAALTERTDPQKA
jgi:protein-tyrosine phosphatase